jgi:hypothetical protein
MKSFWTSPNEWCNPECFECGGTGAPCCEPPDVPYNKLVIFAGNYQQAEQFARQHGFRRRDGFVYAWDAQILRGRRDVQAIVVGTFWDRSDYDNVNDMLEVAKVLNFQWVNGI